jgi:hypothetical protein
MADTELWQPHRIEQGQCIEAQVGPLQLWLRRKGDEVHIASERRTGSENLLKITVPKLLDAQEPDDLDWGRWVYEKCNEVVLTPVTPDRPVVVRPEVPVRIPPGQQALFFVRIPLWIRISVGDGEKIQLCEKASVKLSNIWFGDPMSGELCYSLRSRARRNISDSQVEPHRAVCPVTICNTAISQVEIERFCLHVAHLSVYLGVSRLWTNGVQINFKGEDEISLLEYSKNPPAYEAIEKVLSEPRTPVKKSLLKRSIGNLGLFSGI